MEEWQLILQFVVEEEIVPQPIYVLAAKDLLVCNVSSQSVLESLVQLLMFAMDMVPALLLILAPAKKVTLVLNVP